MKLMNKTLLLATGLCLVGQSLCSDATRTSFSSLRSGHTLLKLSQIQTDEAKKWALPIALGVSGAVGIWTAWTLMKRNASKQSYGTLISAQQPTSVSPATLPASILSNKSSTYCQTLECWQGPHCSLHTKIS